MFCVKSNNIECETSLEGALPTSTLTSCTDFFLGFRQIFWIIFNYLKLIRKTAQNFLNEANGLSDLYMILVFLKVKKFCAAAKKRIFAGVIRSPVG